MSAPSRSVSSSTLNSRWIPSVASLSSQVENSTLNPQPPVPAQTPTIYDRNIHRKRGDVSLSAFAYIFSEAVQYCHRQSRGVSDLEQRLNKLGYHIGLRVLELIVLREGKSAKRETKVLGILQFIHTHVWRALFGKPADLMQVSADTKNQYMLFDYNPLVTEFVSVPRDLPELNCAALVAGIIEAVCCSSGFPAKVGAHTMETDEHPFRTVYVVQFNESVTV